jgi:hypothetical protein
MAMAVSDAILSFVGFHAPLLREDCTPRPEAPGPTAMNCLFQLDPHPQKTVCDVDITATLLPKIFLQKIFPELVHLPRGPLASRAYFQQRASSLVFALGHNRQ